MKDRNQVRMYRECTPLNINTIAPGDTMAPMVIDGSTFPQMQLAEAYKTELLIKTLEIVNSGDIDKMTHEIVDVIDIATELFSLIDDMSEQYTYDIDECRKDLLKNGSFKNPKFVVRGVTIGKEED